MRYAALSFALVLVAVACGGESSEPTATSVRSFDGTTVAGAPALAINDAGEVRIEWAGVTQVSYLAPVPNATDPLFFVHNEPNTDGFYLGLEAYTVFGAGWTGQLGTFAIDCENNGICLHFDPDGPGPAIDAGFDFLASGTIEFVQADLDGFEAILTDVAFTDGTTIPGPLVITGGDSD
jgi:hypothetical protein